MLDYVKCLLNGFKRYLIALSKYFFTKMSFPHPPKKPLIISDVAKHESHCLDARISHQQV